MDVVAEAGFQHAVHVADRDAGLGHLHLDVAGPGVGELALGGAGAGRRLQSGEHVQDPAGDHLAGQAARREGRGRVEGLDHHRLGVEGVEHHHHQARGDGGHDQAEADLQTIAQLKPEASQLSLARLAPQVTQSQGALLVQFLELGVDQLGLLVQEPLGGAGHGRVVLGVVRSQGGGVGVGADPGFSGARLNSFAFAADQPLEHTFRHDSVTPPDVTPRGQSCPLMPRSRCE